MGLLGFVSVVVPINQLMGLGEEAFLEAAAIAYEAAAKTIAAANIARDPKELDDNRKGWLRPNFGSLVDTVRVVYGADLIPAINVLGVKLETSKIAQTFGDRVYLNKHYVPDTDSENNELLFVRREGQAISPRVQKERRHGGD